MHNNLILALVIALFSSQANAIDFGKVLEDAVNQKVEEVTSGDAKSTSQASEIPPTPIATDSTATVLPANPEVAKPIETAETAKPTINWKNPSRDEEIALGRTIAGSLLGAAPLVNDEKLQKYVNQVGRWVASQSERPDLPWKFGVIESGDLNAFAIPGGVILITKGLYQNLQNEAQLAGVLAHEIAHVVKKHQLKVLQKQQLVNAGSDWLKNKFGKKNKLADKAFSTGAEISARSLDKDAEFEADSMGLVLASRAGYDAYGLPEVLQTMSLVKPSDNSVALLFKTHPHPDERLAKLAENVDGKLDGIKAGKTLETRFYKLP
jgi:beta-barrel assembly-enhancing protease